MENWFAKDFDARKAGWKSGLQPIGQLNGKLATFNRGCRMSHCRCGEPMQTLWEKEVLLARGTFQFPKFKQGHRYRLVFGGMSHVNEGEGFQVYVNGKLMLERELRRRWTGRGYPACLQHRQGLVAGFPERQHHDRRHRVSCALEPNNTRNTFLVWLQEMKAPPIGEKEILESAKIVPMLCAGWQAMQDPGNTEIDPEKGKFRWDGKFAPNAKLAGTWTQIGEVATVEAFTPTAQPRSNPLLPAKLTFAANGRTDDPLIYYTGDLLMHLNTNQALKMSLRTADGVEYLFIESGGFTANNAPTWKPGLIVMKRGR